MIEQKIIQNTLLNILFTLIPAQWQIGNTDFPRSPKLASHSPAPASIRRIVRWRLTFSRQRLDHARKNWVCLRATPRCLLSKSYIAARVAEKTDYSSKKTGSAS
jgi:hypothetical protein